jgi:hypothetical protein
MASPFSDPPSKPNPNSFKDYDQLLEKGSLSRNGGRNAGPQLDKTWATEFTANGINFLAKIYLDDYAEEIFHLWASGTAPSEVVFDNARWSEYMQKDENLDSQIAAELEKLAGELRAEVDLNNGNIDRKFLHQFHAFVGKKYGGYRSGYTLLHGSNRTVGDMQISGGIVVNRNGKAGDAYIVEFKDLNFQFNDIIDVNFKYGSDAAFGRAFQNVSKALDKPLPKDYVLRIKWSISFSLKFDVVSTSGIAGALSNFENH